MKIERKMDISVSKKACTTCGEINFDRSAIIYYNKGVFCGEKCRDEDIRRSELHSPIIKYHQNYVPFTLMMHHQSGRK